MERVTEDYVSYEVAKLLKEKGFDEDTERVYERNIMACRYEDYPMPTHQMAMKWLREVHNLCIAPYAAAYRYGFTIDKCDTGSNICNDDVINEELITYEEAVEVALKYCLTELI